MKHLDQIKAFLPSLVKEAGKIILSAHDQGSDSAISSKEGSANFVTVYDVQVQSFLMQRIKEEIPSATFIAEEKDNDSSALDAECCFVIDPIDGTTNFIHDYRHSCISLAVFSRGEPMLGVVYDPYLGEYFHAEKGKGAYLGDKRLCVSSFDLASAVVAYGTSPYYRSTLGDATFALARELFDKTSDLRRCGSAALDLAYLAAGRNDAFFEMRLSPWDFAAGALLITEAGGKLTKLDGSPVSYAICQPILASNGVLHDELVTITSKYN